MNDMNSFDFDGDMYPRCGWPKNMSRNALYPLNGTPRDEYYRVLDPS